MSWYSCFFPNLCYWRHLFIIEFLKHNWKMNQKYQWALMKFSLHNTQKYTAMYAMNWPLCPQSWLRVQSLTCTEKISSYGYSISLWILVGCTNSTPIVIWRIMPTYSQIGIISYFSHEFNRKPTWGTEVAVNSRKFENSSITLAVPHVCDPCMQFFYIYTWNLSKI